MENIQHLLAGLNEKQIEAVQCTEGALLVLAGAGTGKTKVLTTRIANILWQEKAQSDQIMAVTFTNKAAKEMKDRLQKMLTAEALSSEKADDHSQEQISDANDAIAAAMDAYNDADMYGSYTDVAHENDATPQKIISVEGMWMGTFHSLAARFLRYHAELAGLTPQFTIIDTDDQLRLCKELIKSKGLDDKKWPARTLVNTISRWKDNAWLAEDVPQSEGYLFDGHGVELYRKYQAQLTNANACDFGDLLLKALLLFKQNPDLLERYQDWFKYVLVDEYQDTNSVQYQWIRILTMKHKNVCVVGDDDQSIYAWRGAQVGNILRFEKDYPGCTVVKLEQNYRSTSNILRAAAGVISNNRERHDKTLWSAGESGKPVEVHPVWDGKEEARTISRRIQREFDGGLKWQDLAILMRTAAQTRPFEEQFMKDGVPYTIVGGLKFYERKEIRDAVAYLRLVLSEADSMAFERVINVPRRGIGAATIDAIKQIALDRQLSYMAAARVGFVEGLLGRGAAKVKMFIDLIEILRGKTPEVTPERLMEMILDNSGYMKMLEEDKNKEEAQGRKDNLKELLRALKDYDDVTSFLEHVALVTDTESDDEDAVRMTTVHAAKGLEFDTVFIPGFEEGLFPHQRSLNEEGAKGLEEERRLAYVAMTRAERLLIISYASSRYMYGHFENVIPSRFLAEIPEECMKQVRVAGNSPSTPWGGSHYGRKNNGWKQPAQLRKNKPLFSEEEVSPDSGTFAVGSRVFHQKFGYGHIKTVEGKGASEKLTINFEKAGEKKILTAFANLESA